MDRILSVGLGRLERLSQNALSGDPKAQLGRLRALLASG
jgi:hypothetical protein